MQTEIRSDWIGYFKRFKLPSGNILTHALCKFGWCFIIQCVFATLACFVPDCPRLFGAGILLLCISSMIMGTFLFVVFKEFWNIVLEESKGLFADAIMWFLYITLTAITLFLPVLIVDLIFHYI